MSWNFLKEEERKKWDHFVEMQEDSRFIHLTGFKKVVENTYKFKPVYLYFKRGNEILATFSSFIQNSILSGKRIISQPFSEYGGLIFSKWLEEKEKIEILENLFERLRSLMKDEGIKGMEIRGKVSELLEKFSHKIPLGKYGIKRLKSEMDLWNSVDYMVRKAVNKAKREGVSIVKDENFDKIKDFYRLHLISMKRLGSPPHPLSYFLSLKHELMKKIEIIYAVYQDKIISALLGWKVGKSVHVTDNPSDRRFFHLRANDLLFYKLIEWALENNYEIFDLGPMRYEGQEFYKKKWNLEALEYSIYHYPFPISSIAYKPPFYVELARRIWKYVPCYFAKRTGKFLRKELGL